jgi:predicted O-methyltransferase YrrM
LDAVNYIVHFVKHRLKAHSLNDIHSPFVFDLAEKVLKSNEEFYVFKAIELERKKLLSSSKTLSVQDFGAGSKTLASNQRMIKDIAKTSLKPAKYAQLLFKIINHLHYKNIVELGTSLGITTAYLASSGKDINVLSLEGSEAIASEAKKVHKNLRLTNIEILIGEFDNTLPIASQKLPSIDFLYIDGNHRKAPTLKYFEHFLPQLHNNSLVVFDDIYWSKEMTEAWKEIKQHPKVNVTIDIFEMGLVFLRTEQPKQHFKITM